MRRRQSRCRRSSALMSCAISGSTSSSETGMARTIRRQVVYYHPSQDEFRQAAERGNLIPVYREILADGDTPVGAYAKLGRGDHSFLLESVVGGEKWATYS